MSGALEEHEEDTIFRNIRLVLSFPRNVFIFILNPILAYSLFFLLVLPGTRVDILPFEMQAYATLGYLFISFFVLIGWGEQVKDELREAGYVQRRTRRREIDLWINYAVCGAWMFWLFRTDRNKVKDPSSRLLVYLYIFSMQLAMWICAVTFSLGSVLWFSVRVRRRRD